jgi:hypothetical protein
MGKKKDAPVEVELRIPKELEAELRELAKLANVPVEHVVMIALAREIYRRKK